MECIKSKNFIMTLFAMTFSSRGVNTAQVRHLQMHNTRCRCLICLHDAEEAIILCEMLFNLLGKLCALWRPQQQSGQLFTSFSLRTAWGKVNFKMGGSEFPKCIPSILPHSMAGWWKFLMCYIFMMGRLIAKMFSTFSLWGCLFLMGGK